MFGKRKSAALVAEFLGAGALTLLVLSVQRSTIGVPFFVAAAAGVVLTLVLFVFGDLTTGFFNPAITLGLWTARKLNSATAALNILAQLLGGWGAYALYKYFSNAPLQAIGGTFKWRILIAEGVGTAIFALGLAAAIYKRYTPSVTAAFAGIAFMVGIVAASSASIGLLNPAIALGVNAWDVWGSMGWGTYVLGPVVGAIVGINLYDLLFAAEGEADSLLAVTGAASVITIASTTEVIEKTISKPKTTRTTTTKKRTTARRKK